MTKWYRYESGVIGVPAWRGKQAGLILIYETTAEVRAECSDEIEA